jgi:hypothetical protein
MYFFPKNDWLSKLIVLDGTIKMLCDQVDYNYEPLFQAAAANRRLKEALAKQKQVIEERNQKFEKCDKNAIGNRVRVSICFLSLVIVILYI